MKRVMLCAGIAALLAGCGSNSPTSPSKSAAQSFVTHALAKQIAYAQCLRTHGVPNFPDPKIKQSAQGTGVSQGVPASVGQSPAFASAQHACAKLMPAGAQGPTQPATAAQHAQDVTFAACVRKHGVPNMPDPAPNGVFNLPPQINQNAPAFMAAVKGCVTNGMSLSLNQGGPAG
jgi:hypothetical protein